MGSFFAIFRGFYVHFKQLPSFNRFLNFQNSYVPEHISLTTFVTANLIHLFIAHLFIVRQYREYRFWCVVNTREAFYSRPGLSLVLLDGLMTPDNNQKVIT